MKIIFVAGGTGGHIYPAITLANELKARGHEILFIGSSTRMEKDVIPGEGFEYIGLDVSIPKGNVFIKALSLISLLKAENKCIELVKGYDVAIGFGNYISLPVMLAAKKQGLKTIIHEQNSFAGKANLYLDKKMDYVLCSYDDNLRQFKNPNTFVYGNPQSSKALMEKEDKSCISMLGLDPNKKTVLTFMGSLGSSSVDKILLEYFSKTDGSYQIIYARGNDHDEILSNYSFGKHIVIKDKIEGSKYIKNTDLVIARSGATTVSEIIACGKPSILIPSPYVPQNHQYYNALSLSENNATILINEKELTSNLLNEKVDSIIKNDDKLKDMGTSAKKLLKANIIENIIGIVEK